MDNAREIIKSAKEKLPEASTYPYDLIRIPILPEPEPDPMPISLLADLKLHFDVEFRKIKVIKNGQILHEWEFVNIY